MYGSIWYFSAFTLVGFVFCVCCIRETRGLTDLQKKTLYSPKAIYDEDLIIMVDIKKTPSKTTDGPIIG